MAELELETRSHDASSPWNPLRGLLLREGLGKWVALVSGYLRIQGPKKSRALV